MKFTKLRLVGLETVDLPLVGEALPTDQYILKAADGLSSSDVDVFIQQTLHQGGVYQNRRPQGRQAIFRIGLNPDYVLDVMVSDLREKLYGMLTPGYPDQATLRVMSGSTVLARTFGHVSSLTPALFSKDPEVNLTLDCMQAYLEAPTAKSLTGLSTSAPQIVNEGDYPSGFRMELTFTAATSGFTLTNSASGEKLSFEGYTFAIGDKLIIDTNPGSRVLQIDKAGVISSALRYRTKDSVWLMLRGGTTTFTTSSTAFTWGPVTYTPKYWGV